MTSESDQMDDADAGLRRAYAARPLEPGGHPDEALWERLACGDLTADERTTLAGHVTRCAACAGVYRAVVQVAAEARRFDPQVPPSAPRRRDAARLAPLVSRYRSALALAAVLLLAVAGVAVYRALARSERGGAAATVATQTSPAPPEAVAARPALRLALDIPEVKLPPELTVAMRGPSGARAQAFLDDFGRAIAPYRSHEFAAAASSLRALTSRYPDVVEVWFYLGVSELLAERPDRALAAFARAGNGGAAGEDLPWYRAIALDRAGRTDELARVLAGLCERPGPWRDRACEAIGVPTPPARP